MDKTTINKANEDSIASTKKSIHTGKKLAPAMETFNLDDGDYSGNIINAFNYTEDKIMLKIKLTDDRIFNVVTNEERINQYPYSQLIMESGAEYIDQLIGLDVDFAVKNNISNTGLPFSNVKRISLQKQ